MKNKIRYSKHLFLLGILIFVCSIAFGQGVEPASTQGGNYKIPDAFFDPITYLVLMMGGIILLTIFAMSRTIIVLTKIIEGKDGSPAQENISESLIEKEEGPSLSKRIMKALVKSVPIENEKDVMLDHNYDGIQELDNQLPPWWKYGFYATILFAFVYLFNFHVSGSGKLQLAEYKQELKTAEIEAKVRMQNTANNINESNVDVLTDPALVAEGKGVFMKYCNACHGDFGQGIVGPNLTDEFWLHGGGVKNVFKTVTDGVSAKGMISWKSQLSPKAIQEVASYILTLKGTKPDGAKEPQGVIWVDEEKSISLHDSTDVDSTEKSASIK